MHFCSIEQAMEDWLVKALGSLILRFYPGVGEIKNTCYSSRGSGFSSLSVLTWQLTTV